MSSILNKLNKNQKEAAETIQGPVLILAGAGSGKTRTVTHRIAYMIKEKNISPYNILALTFTNKAAKEMKERAISLIGSKYSEDIVITTFHSFALKVLKKYAPVLRYRSNFTIYDTDDQKSVIKNILKKYGEHGLNVKEVVNLISKLKEKQETVDVARKKYKNNSLYVSPMILDCYEEYQEVLFKNNAMDFTDLLLNLNLVLNNKEILEEIQERYKYIIIDEYQDTNALQYEIVTRIANKYKNICVVGDENQSIYMFRGADISNILNFKNDYKDAKIIKLEQNYRSTKTILNAANSVIKNNSSDTGKKLYSENEVGKKIEVNESDNIHIETTKVVDKIFDYVSNSKASYKDFTILYRINSQSRSIEEKLRNYRIPHKVFGGINFYKRKEIKALIGYLNLLNNIDDDLSFVNVVNNPRRGIGSKTMDTILETAAAENVSYFDAIQKIEFKGKIQDSVNEFVDLFKRLIKLKEKNKSLKTILEEIVNSIDVDQLLHDDRKEKYDNIEELKRSVVEYEKTASNPTLDDYLSSIALYTTVDDLDTDDYVKLMTIHSSKGLEFDYVFIIGMEEGVFPLIRNNMITDMELEEERRLCYVAITRAKKELYISYSKKQFGYNDLNYDDIKSKSRFIDEIDSEYIETPKNSTNKKTKEKTVVENFNPLKNNKKEVDTIFKIGDKVIHPKYNLGRVLSIDEKIIVVEFGVETKNISTQLAERVLQKA